MTLRLTPPDQNEAFGDRDGDGEEGVMGNSTMGPMEEVRKGKRRSLEDALANTGTPDLELTQPHFSNFIPMIMK